MSKINMVTRALAMLPLASPYLLNPASATLLPINNPSFESPAYADGGFGAGITGWTVAGLNLAGTFNPTDAEYNTGGSGDLFTVGGLSNQVGISSSGDWAGTQVQGGAVLSPGTYTLTIGIGNRANATMGTYFIAFAAGNSVLGRFDLVTETSNAELFANGFITDRSLVYNATPSDPYLGSNLWIVIMGGVNNDFDNVRLDYQELIPEPSLVLLFATGGALLAWRHRRPSRSQPA